MIGRIIESRRPFPWDAFAFVLVTLPVLLLALLARNYHVAVFAVLPLLIALALAARTPRSLSLELTATSIEVHDPQQSIPYDSLESLIAPHRPGDPDESGPRYYPIDVVHENGTLHIPALLNVSSDELFSFLLSTFPMSGSPHVNPVLRGYLDEQSGTFGPERVWSYRARSNLGKPAPGKGTGVCLAILLTGIVWVVVGIVVKADGWIATGILSVMFGGLFALLFWAQSGRSHSRRIKGWEKAGLVISPVGMALIQGDLKGEMRWDELRDVKLKQATHSFQLGHRPYGWGILLSFEGAHVSIADIYDRPLNIIYKQICNYWREP